MSLKNNLKKYSPDGKLLEVCNTLISRMGWEDTIPVKQNMLKRSKVSRFMIKHEFHAEDLVWFISTNNNTPRYLGALVDNRLYNTPGADKIFYFENVSKGRIWTFLWR